MENTHETQKEKTKEKTAKLTGEHYEGFWERSAHEDFTTDQTEEPMLEQQKKIRGTLGGSNSELASNIKGDAKKSPECGGHLRRTKKGER